MIKREDLKSINEKIKNAIIALNECDDTKKEISDLFGVLNEARAGIDKYLGKTAKKKYAVTYEEVFRRTFIIEADSEEEARERMEYLGQDMLLNEDDYYVDNKIGEIHEASKAELDLCVLLPWKK